MRTVLKELRTDHCRTVWPALPGTDTNSRCFRDGAPSQRSNQDGRTSAPERDAVSLPAMKGGNEHGAMETDMRVAAMLRHCAGIVRFFRLRCTRGRACLPWSRLQDMRNRTAGRSIGAELRPACRICSSGAGLHAVHAGIPNCGRNTHLRTVHPDKLEGTFERLGEK